MTEIHIGTLKVKSISEAKRWKASKDEDERIKMEVNKQVFKDVVEMYRTANSCAWDLIKFAR